VDHNLALGGDGADGGDGLGGGVYNDHSSFLTLRASTVTKNHANGGDAGAGGTNGQGVGGGVYNLGLFDYDDLTRIDDNHASTSNDDIFSI